MKVILASRSPRRIKMMEERGYIPEIRPAEIDETLPFDMASETAVMYLAFKKAQHVADAIGTEADACDTEPGERYAVAEDAVVIAADTVVVYENRIIGKPADRQEAFETLSELRSKSHYVLTGVCIIRLSEDADTAEEKICFCDRTDVYFTDYTDEELAAYVETDEPYDKAGGYAIQGTFGRYVERIEGSYDNVVGFPIDRISKYL